MTAGQDTPAKSTKTGNSKSASPQRVFLLGSVLKTLLSSRTMDRPARRLGPEDIHARLILIIGSSLAACFVLVTAFGFGLIVIWLSPLLVKGLLLFNVKWLPLTVLIAFLILGSIADKKNQL